jgi:hypothetical protein
MFGIAQALYHLGFFTRLFVFIAHQRTASTSLVLSALRSANERDGEPRASAIH